ncbi:hypothetical protein [Mycobacterium kyogaense]|uniref:hypothetical protein n=1 Tax=Mycobacterium kyogaense TaxID=2212479 RepID=UPI001F0981BB|nr:hypothetical protein [Mycobacterium kyogaense]
MSIDSKRLSLAGSLLVAGLVMMNAPTARAEPIAPLTPAEAEYLQQLHYVLRVTHDPIAFKGDGELLTRGRRVCEMNDLGLYGAPATLETPAINQLARIYLCAR